MTKTVSKTTSQSSKTPPRGEDTHSRLGHVARRGLLWLVIIAAVGIGAAAAFSGMQRVVLDHRAEQGPVPYTIEFTHVPHWMPEELTDLLRADLMPEMAFNAEELCPAVHHRAALNVWIKHVGSVQRERVDDGLRGVIRVDATFRQPAAAARHGGQVGFVDAEGVRLPDVQVPRYASRDRSGRVSYHLSTRTVPRGLRPLRIHYLLIDGVAAPPAPVGKRWVGGDLQDGLRLAALLKTRPYVNQVTVIDVRNYGQRVSDMLPELVFYAQMKYQGRQSEVTKVFWGRFPHPDGDWVITPERKMTYLDRYADRHDGRLAGVDRALDLRHDHLILP